MILNQPQARWITISFLLQAKGRDLVVELSILGNDINEKMALNGNLVLTRVGSVGCSTNMEPEKNVGNTQPNGGVILPAYEIHKALPDRCIRSCQTE